MTDLELTANTILEKGGKWDTIDTEKLEKKSYIRSKISTTDMLVQVAEECNELSAAVLKLIRKLNKDNPTPKSEKEIIASIQEE